MGSPYRKKRKILFFSGARKKGELRIIVDFESGNESTGF